MRAFLTFVFSLVVLITSCTKSGAPFQPGGALSAMERQNIVTIHQGFAGWNPTDSAFWGRGGNALHVCIREGGVGGFTQSAEAFIFDGDGRVVEANILDVPMAYTAKTLSGVLPLQVAYRRRDGETVFCGGRYSRATWRHEMQKQKEVERRILQIVESWRSSGSTNSQELHQMIQTALTNSQQ